MNSEPRTLIEVGHSPDADDAFMFYALTAGKVETGDLECRHVLRDIEPLNRWAIEGRLPVTALSLHAYAYAAEKYALLPHGASMGRRYGPILVSRKPLSPDALRRETIASPGTPPTPSPPSTDRRGPWRRRGAAPGSSSTRGSSRTRITDWSTVSTSAPGGMI